MENYSCSLPALLEQLQDVLAGEGEEEGGVCACGVRAAAFFPLLLPLDDLSCKSLAFVSLGKTRSNQKVFWGQPFKCHWEKNRKK